MQLKENKHITKEADRKYKEQLVHKLVILESELERAEKQAEVCDVVTYENSRMSPKIKLLEAASEKYTEKDKYEEFYPLI